MSSKDLLHRLNRAIGQIDALRKKIETGQDTDCLNTLRQLKASINALKKFGEAYMTHHLEACLSENKSPHEMKDDLTSVISGAFSL
jgi:DNA-binding FrmR family transcriptional regulator